MDAPSGSAPAWRQRTVLLAVGVAILVRLIGLSQGDFEPWASIQETYFSTAAGLASGYGYISETVPAARNNHGFDQPTTVIAFMKAREAAGGRVDREHPFPKSAENWIPGTRHPHGYGTLVYIYYTLFNYRGALWALHITQILLDASACLLIFVFARNVFDIRVGKVAAWGYALCPPLIFLSLDLMPDTFHGFFVAAVLALASGVKRRGVRAALLAGAVLGVACYFRTEYILLPGVLFFAFLAATRRFGTSIACSAGMAAVMLTILLPSAFWYKNAIGQFRFTTTTSGGTCYESIGEDPKNALGVVCEDTWMNEDAIRRGFVTPWGAEGDAFYGREFKNYVLSHPLAYAGVVVKQRLPLALAPPYATGKRESQYEFNFSMYRTSEGLTRWGVIKKYPFRVLKYLWPQISMLGYSALLTLCFAATLIINRKRIDRVAWIFMPWFYTVGSICLVKAIEPRNLAPTLVPAVTALGFMAVWLRIRFGRKKQPA